MTKIITQLNKSAQLETHWVNSKSVYRTSCNANEVVISFSKNTKNVLRANISIGKDIMKTLNWKVNDRLSMFYDQNNILHWMICEAENGYKITESKHFVRFHANWDKEGKWPKQPIKVDVGMHKDKITFFIPELRDN